MLSENQVLQVFDHALPAEIRPQMIRRLHRLPVVWSALHEEAFLAKAVSFAGADPERWRPGLLGLLQASETDYLRARFAPETRTAPKLAESSILAAETALHALEDGKEPTLDQAALAALALVKTPAAKSIPTQTAPLVWTCLYAIAPDSHGVTQRLAEALPSSAGMLVEMLLANEDDDSAASICGKILDARDLTDAAVLCDAAIRMGEDAFAHRFGVAAAHKDVSDSPNTEHPARRITRAKLFRTAGEPAAALPEADAARRSARRLLEESVRESALAAEAVRNFTAALSFWQEADSLTAHGAGTRAGIARAFLGLGREADALAALPASGEPEDLLTAAHIRLKTGAREQALDTARQAYAKCAPDTDPHIASQIADVLADCGDTRNAAQVLTAVVKRWPSNVPTLTRLAGFSAQMRDWRACNQAAASAWRLAPEDTNALRLLAQSSLQEGRPAEAAEYYRTLCAKLPDDLPSLLALAQSGLAAGERTEAKTAARHALELNANSGEAHAVLGQIALAEGDGEAAFAALQKATRLSPAATGAWKGLAELHVAHGNREAAITTLRAGTESAADPAELLLALGRLLMDGGLLREAASILERALGLRQGDADILVALAESYLGMDRASEAEDCLQRALDLAPQLVSASRTLAGLLVRSERGGEARTILERALAVNPQCLDLLKDLGSLLLDQFRKCASGDPAILSAASSALRQAFAVAGDTPDARLQSLLGWAHAFSGELTEAVAMFSGLLRGAENLSLEQKVDAFRGLAEALLRGGDYATAVSNLQSALQLMPGEPTIRQRLGEALAASGLLEDAREVFRLILAEVPGDPGASIGLADVLTAMGKANEAIAMLREATELSPANPGLWIRLAESLGKTGNTDQTQDLLTHAIQAAGIQDADVPLHAGRLLLSLGDFAGAETIFEQALMNIPSSVALLTEWGNAERQSGKHGKAFEAFRRASELEADNPGHLRNAAESLWDDGRKSAAIAFLKKAALMDPQNVALLRRLASALSAVGFSREALPVFEQAMAAAPKDTGLALEAARAALRAGDLEKADAWKECGSGSKEPTAEGMVLKARIALEKGNAAEAASVCEKLTAAFPEDARGWALLAQSQGLHTSAKGNRGEPAGPMDPAKTALRKAIELSGDSPESLALTGAACLLLEEYGDAVRCLESLIGKSPEDPEAHTLFAKACIQRAEALYREQLAGAGSLWAEAVSGSVSDSVRAALARAAAVGAEEESLQPLFTRAALAFSHTDPETIANLQAADGENPSAETCLAIAQAWLRAGDEQKAYKAAEAAVNLAPGLPSARILKGICDWRNGRRETALAALYDASTAAPHLALPHALAATILAELDRREEARREMELAVQAAPDAAGWQHTLGRWNEEAGNFSAALPHLQRAADQEPRNGKYHLHLAHSLFRDGDPQNALVHFHQAAALSPEADSSLQAEIGKAALESGNYTEAYEAFHAAQEQTGPAAPFAWALGKARAALALGRRDEARALARTVLEGAGHPPEARLILAEVDESEGKLQDAIRHLDRAATEMSDPVLPALRLAKLWTATGAASRSVAALQAMIEANPESDDAHHLLAEALFALGRTEEALRESQKAVGLAPRNSAHWILQGQIARKLGQLDQSLAALTKAHEIAPADWRSGFEIGLTYEAEQRWDLALETYRTALRLAPENAELHYRLGVAHKNMRSYAEAATALRRAIQIEPQNLAAHTLLSGVMALGLVYGSQSQPMETR
jgi:tetratricopeptide (TPR) repeat protein